MDITEPLPSMSPFTTTVRVLDSPFIVEVMVQPVPALPEVFAAPVADLITRSVSTNNALMFAMVIPPALNTK